MEIGHSDLDLHVINQLCGADQWCVCFFHDGNKFPQSLHELRRIGGIVACLTGYNLLGDGMERTTR